MLPLTLAMVIADREIQAQVQECLSELSIRVVIEQPEIGDWDGLLDKIERLKPDVLLLELAPVWSTLEQVVRNFRRCAVSPAVIALHSATDPDSILRAVRAGVAEYLYPPYAAGLRSALERLAGERAPQRDQAGGGKTLAFFSAKGGCGASTLACHVALELIRQAGRDLLLADFDLDSGIIGFLLKTKSSYTVLDALANVHRLDLSFWKALISNGTPGLEVLSAPASFSVWQPGEPERFRQILRFARLHYAWIVTDLGRGLSVKVMSSLEEIDQSYLVTTIDVPALYRAKHVIRTLRDSGYSPDRLRVILNRVPRRTDVTTAEMEQMLGVPVAAALPEDSAALYECYADGKLLPPNTPIGKLITAFTRKLTGVQAAGKARGGFSLLG